VGSRGLTSERAEALERCVETLPKPYQEMLRLRYGKSLKISQVASAFGRTVAATQRALSRIRKRLAECIENRLATINDGER
jgi:RNA polymerase sigma-70 factor, ECF subfamily